LKSPANRKQLELRGETSLPFDHGGPAPLYRRLTDHPIKSTSDLRSSRRYL